MGDFRTENGQKTMGSTKQRTQQTGIPVRPNRDNKGCQNMIWLRCEKSVDEELINTIAMVDEQRSTCLCQRLELMPERFCSLKTFP